MLFKSALWVALSGCLVGLGSGCVSFESAMQSARPVVPGETVTTVAANLGVDHYQSVFAAEQNIPPKIPSYGIAGMVRHGLVKNLDLGLKLSADRVGIDSKYAFYLDSRFAGAIGAGVTWPVVNTIDLETYRLVVPAYVSHNATRRAEFYFAPALEILLSDPDDLSYGGSLGVLFGVDWGILGEVSYFENTRRDTAREQYRIGLVSSLDKLSGREEIGPLQYLYRVEFGFLLAPMLGAGVVLDTPADIAEDFEFGISYGVGQDAGQLTKSSGYSRFLIVSATWVQAVMQDTLFSVAGVARRAVWGSVLLDDGFGRFNASSYGMFMALRQNFVDFKVNWLGLYIPFGFLPRGSSISGYDGATRSDVIDSIRRYEVDISWQLLAVQVGI